MSNENWVGVTPEPDSLVGVLTPTSPQAMRKMSSPEARHYVWTDASSYTACGISVAHGAALLLSTDGATVTCDQCDHYLRTESHLARGAHDCVTDGHEYEMIQTLEGDIVAMLCPQCNTKWKVEKA